MSDELLFVVGGRALTAEQLRARAPKRKAKARAPDAEPLFMGWRVVGHRQDDLREAMALAREKGKELDVPQWRRNTRKQPISRRPYEVKDAALQCAGIAERFGWIDIEVEEVKRG